MFNSTTRRLTSEISSRSTHECSCIPPNTMNEARIGKNEQCPRRRAPRAEAGGLPISTSTVISRVEERRGAGRIVILEAYECG